jgi:hypothetical protein
MAGAPSSLCTVPGNRSIRTGYRVVRLFFDKSGKPTGKYEDFITGFFVSDKQVWGRPVGVAVARDGSRLERGYLPVAFPKEVWYPHPECAHRDDLPGIGTRDAGISIPEWKGP